MSIEAMKQALEDKSLYEITGSITDIDKCIIHRFDLIQAIAEAEKQEPVPIGELSEFLDCEKCSHCQTVNEDRDNYCLLQRKVVYETCEKFSHWEGKPRPIYPPAAQPAQPKRQWVGLTEQERNDIEDLCEMMIGKPAFDAIEKKLKGKNT